MVRIGMAGLIGLTAADMEIQDALGAVRWAYDGAWEPRPVVRLTTSVPIADRTRQVVRARWGFQVNGRAVGNCRDDRLLESPMWRHMLGKQHCLVAATGIYEMTGKQSWWFRRRDGELIVMPGLASTWTIDGENKLCAAIVTTSPNPFFARFHDRQVCVLDGPERDAWLADGDPEELMQLLHAPERGAWEAVPVHRRIFGKGRLGPDALQPTGRPVQDDGSAPSIQARLDL